MKKLFLTTLALAVGATFAYSQGTVTIANTVAANFIRTNTTQVYSEGATGSGTSGLTKTTGAYRYTVLFTDYGGAVPTTNPFDAVWDTSPVTGQSTVTAGGIAGPNSVAVTGWPAPTAGFYSTGTQMYYMIVGWSANLGTTWADVTTFWNNETAGRSLIRDGQIGGINYFFGTSAVAQNVSGGGPGGLAAVNLFSTSQTGIAGAGLGSGFDLFLVPEVPEPSSFALAGLGAAALLIFRRRK